MKIGVVQYKPVEEKADICCFCSNEVFIGMIALGFIAIEPGLKGLPQRIDDMDKSLFLQRVQLISVGVEITGKTAAYDPLSCLVLLAQSVYGSRLSDTLIASQ